MITAVDRLKTVLGDRYQIERELGAGGMATVYLARDRRHDRDVALKVMKPEVASELGAERFVREIKLAARLTHPHILPLHDSGEADGFLYYVMPAIEGQSVRDRLERERQLPVEEALSIAREVADALDYAHQHDVVHRDIKPENILLHGGHALVADFGIGKALSAAADSDSDAITQTGVTIGTPTYMSPEQVAGDEELDGRSDLYSLGCVLYEMLVGEPPFTGPTPQVVMARRFTHTPPDVTATREAVSGHVSRVVRRLLASTPADRYATGSKVVEALAGGAVGSALEGAAEKSIAVLPFANVSTDPENEFFSDGITEEIINALAQVEGLHVASRTSSFYFKGKTLEMREIAERLQVATLLEGSVRKVGNRVRITAQLIDVAKDEHLWSERYDRDMKDIFAIQDEIARTIGDRLKLTLEGGAETTLVKRHTDNVEAYQLYLKGRALLYKRGVAIPRGLDCIKQALSLDPDYAVAYTGLADGYTTLGYYGFAPGQEAMPQAKDAATRALELVPDLAEAHNAVAMVKLLYDRDWPAAEAAFRHALELNPQYVQARAWYGLFYLSWCCGRFEEGVAEARRCVEIDPLSGYNGAVLALALSLANRHEEAVEQATAAAQLDPDAYVTRLILQLTQHWASRYPEAEHAADAALAVSGRHLWAMADLAAVYGESGKQEKATSIFEELRARTGREYVQPSMFAVAAVGAGRLDEAVALLERAYEERDPFLTAIARHWPQYGPLRDDPRGQEIIAKMGYP